MKTDPAAPVKAKGIAILGSHPVTRPLAPFGDEEWLIYACSPDNTPHGNSQAACDVPRFDEWFELHNPVEDKSRPYNYIRSLENIEHLWMRDQRAMKNFPGARLYPEKDLRGEMRLREDGSIDIVFGVFNYYMFTSSIAYMLAKAIVDCEANAIPHIGLFGIMQASKNEYEYQRPGIQYFLHEAERRGINVIAPDVSNLFHPPPDQW